MSKLTDQKSTAELLAELEAGKTRIATAAESYQTALAEKQAAFKLFQTNPAAVPVSEAVRIITELNGLTELTERFDAQLVDYLQRHHAERSYRENADAFADALEADLAAATIKFPERKKSFIAWLAGLPAKIYQSEVNSLERAALLEEREKRELAEEILESNIAAAKNEIRYYRANPLPENYGRAAGSVAGINLG